MKNSDIVISTEPNPRNPDEIFVNSKLVVQGVCRVNTRGKTEKTLVEAIGDAKTRNTKFIEGQLGWHDAHRALRILEDEIMRLVPLNEVARISGEFSKIHNQLKFQE